MPEPTRWKNILRPSRPLEKPKVSFSKIAADSQHPQANKEKDERKIITNSNIKRCHTAQFPKDRMNTTVQ
jgi:hypothetical protein